jgi:CRISPR-associated protein Cas1
MISRIVEVGSPARLSYKNKQLRVEREGEEPAHIPIEDLGVLVLDNEQITLTAALLSACAEANVAVVTCGAKHIPASLLAPFEGNTLHAKTLREQIEMPESKKKRTWQQIVQAKIREQSRLLIELHGKDGDIGKLQPFVRSGDPDNLEARAARKYWPLLFGDGFIREREGDGVNSMLNYGYAVVRASVARAIVAAGLHPALGIHHRNQYNAFALADDVMEPLRPLVDAIVFAYLRENGEPDELTPQVKRTLLGALTQVVGYGNKRYPLMTALGLYAANVRKCLLGRAQKLECPNR